MHVHHSNLIGKRSVPWSVSLRTYKAQRHWPWALRQLSAGTEGFEGTPGINIWVRGTFSINSMEQIDPCCNPIRSSGTKGTVEAAEVLDVNVLQVVRFPAQNHSRSSLAAAVVLTAAISGQLVFCLFLAAPEEKKQALGWTAPEPSSLVSCTLKTKLFPLMALCRYQSFVSAELV